MKPWKFQTKTKFHQKKVKFSKLFANLLRWSLENFEKSADLGPLPAEIELLPVEIYKVYKQIFKKINFRWKFTKVYKQNFKKIPISPFSDPNWPSFLPLYLKYLEKFREKSADIRFRSVHLPSKGDKHLAKKPVNYCRKHEELEPFTTVYKHSTANLCHFRFRQVAPPVKTQKIRFLGDHWLFPVRSTGALGPSEAE